MTASDTASATSPAVRAYLRRATWGLSRVRQQEVWDELEEHLLIRAEQWQHLGASPDEALARALAELGSPARVSAGMTKVYLMPKLILTASLAALTLSAVLYAAAGGSEGKLITLPLVAPQPSEFICMGAISSGTHSIYVLPHDPSGTENDPRNPQCFVPESSTFYAKVFIDTGALQAAIEPQGGSVKMLTPDYVAVQFPGSSIEATGKIVTENGKPYLLFSSLIESLLSQSTISESFKLKSYKQPIFDIGKVELQFQINNFYTAKSFYDSLGGAFVASALGKVATGKALTLSGSLNVVAANAPLHAIKTDLAEDEVVLLVTKGVGNAFVYEVRPVGVQGFLDIRSEKRHLKFVGSSARLTPTPTDNHTPALLVRVTNIPLSDLNSGIFVPAQATSDAN